MCIIAAPVRSVKSTQLFLVPSVGGKRQLTVYKNTVATASDNLMILPVPNPTTIRFEPGVMAYKNLFTDAKASFHALSVHPRHLERFYRDKSPLRVLDVGPYRASVAGSIADLERLDESVFFITANLRQFLEREYAGTGMGFICCQLRSGETAYEPIAYSHDLEEGTLFAPTMHYHLDGGAPDWDHEIFTIGTTTAAHRNHEAMFLPKEWNEISWDQMPPEFQHTTARRLHRWCAIGDYPNMDMRLRLA